MVAHEISRRLREIQAKPPGREATFGNLAFRHEILHWIGGEDDSNANTTRRILLLLESKPIGRAEAWDRVLNNVLSRYLTEDLGLWQKTKDRGVPLFFLNDIARYWRTMVVDFPSKLGQRIGVTRQTIAAIEAGKYSPSLEAAFRIAHAFQVPLHEVFQWENR
jgi:DNA-binding XRE family transcriptional regulator